MLKELWSIDQGTGNVPHWHSSDDPQLPRCLLSQTESKKSKISALGEASIRQRKYSEFQTQVCLYHRIVLLGTAETK